MALQAAVLLTMGQNRFRRIALYASAGIGLLLALVGLLFAVEQWRTHVYTGEVLSASFSQVVLQDMDQGVQDAQSGLSFCVIRHAACVRELKGGSKNHLGVYRHGNWYQIGLHTRDE